MDWLAAAVKTHSMNCDTIFKSLYMKTMYVWRKAVGHPFQMIGHHSTVWQIGTFSYQIFTP